MNICKKYNKGICFKFRKRIFINVRKNSQYWIFFICKDMCFLFSNSFRFMINIQTSSLFGQKRIINIQLDLNIHFQKTPSALCQVHSNFNLINCVYLYQFNLSSIMLGLKWVIKKLFHEIYLCNYPYWPIKIDSLESDYHQKSTNFNH